MKDELKKAIGQRLREIRKTLGYTQEKMVSFFDIGRANYSRIEKGEVWPSINILYKLRSQFNISLDWLVSNNGKMFKRKGKEKIDESTLKLDFGEDIREVKELLNFMEKVPMVKHAILSYFLEYRVKHGDIIQQFLKESEESIIPLNKTDDQ